MGEVKYHTRFDFSTLTEREKADCAHHDPEQVRSAQRRAVQFL